MVELRELDERITYAEQLQHETGPIVLMNQFNVPPGDVDRFLEVWADDAAFMKLQPGFISTQLHRGTAGSTAFVNVAIWESARALGAAVQSLRSRTRGADYPEETVATPHVFEKVAVPNICVA
jgi:heme-degrading monooxygenase HmoA